MIRSAFYSFILVAIAAVAVVTVAPNTVFSAQTQTVKAADSDAVPHKLILEKCALEDCSDTPQ
jgi:hypothetical protein